MYNIKEEIMPFEETDFMKKKYEIFKSIQLLVLVILTALGLMLIFTDGELYQQIGSSRSVKSLAALLWLSLGLSYAFVLVDFRINAGIKKDYKELNYALHNDRVAGIANRYSCDAIIDKYVDKPLPPEIGCVMLEISNIRDINEQHGHLAGNASIQEFANILLTSSVGICFVGRNGGNKFMALFEDCSEEKINSFLTRINQKIDTHNSAGESPRLEYKTGRAYGADESVTTITGLIGLADRRLASQTDALTGFANRSGCDDIISLYIDKPLPERIGCVMLEITNIREINEEGGHLEGNRAIRRFGDALHDAATGLCFTGRNGGSKFMALFEDCSEEKLDTFFGTLGRKVEASNMLPGVSRVKYAYGVAFKEGPSVNAINKLVALSDRRLNEKKQEAANEGA